MMKTKIGTHTKKILMAKNKCFLLFPILSFLLAGCAGMNSKFDCPMTAGVRCESLDQVNARIDRGEMGGTTKKTAPNALLPVNVAWRALGNQNVRPPVRVPDKTMRIWAAPYEDSSHNYHEASFIYTVVKQSSWGAPNVESGEIQHV